MMRKLVEDMFETMYDAPGIGLAAIQIGVAKRIVTMDIAKKEATRRRSRASSSIPEITWSSEEKSHLRGRLPVDPGLFTRTSSGRRA